MLKGFLVFATNKYFLFDFFYVAHTFPDCSKLMRFMLQNHKPNILILHGRLLQVCVFSLFFDHAYIILKIVVKHIFFIVIRCHFYWNYLESFLCFQIVTNSYTFCCEITWQKSCKVFWVFATNLYVSWFLMMFKCSSNCCNI
jgi:hypothetical protein